MSKEQEDTKNAEKNILDNALNLVATIERYEHRLNVIGQEFMKLGEQEDEQRIKALDKEQDKILKKLEDYKVTLNKPAYKKALADIAENAKRLRQLEQESKVQELRTEYLELDQTYGKIEKLDAEIVAIKALMVEGYPIDELREQRRLLQDRVKELEAKFEKPDIKKFMEDSGIIAKTFNEDDRDWTTELESVDNTQKTNSNVFGKDGKKNDDPENEI